jgi:hypothetical protein
MKTPIHIEAHYELRRKIIHSAPDEGAQLIADSEARATRKQIEALEITTRRWLNVEKERDQLRAEVERACEVEHELRAEVKRMTRYYEYDHKCLCEVQDRCHLWKQRAKKAEAELAKYLSACPASPTEEERKRCQQWWSISGRAS